MTIPLTSYAPHVDAPIVTSAAPRAALCSAFSATSGDVLWRLTTKAWARQRAASLPVAPHAWRDRLEVAVTTLSLVGMGLMTLACFVA